MRVAANLQFFDHGLTMVSFQRKEKGAELLNRGMNLIQLLSAFVLLSQSLETRVFCSSSSQLHFLSINALLRGVASLIKQSWYSVLCSHLLKYLLK